MLQNQLQAGKATLKTSTNPKQFYKAMTSRCLSIVNRETWDFSNGKWVKSKGKQFFTLIKLAKVKVLCLQCNHHQFLLQQVVPLNAPLLKELKLFFNKISSLQLLQSINMPSLVKLSLDYNYITNISSLRKLQIPNLTWLALQSNKIKQLQSISQLNCPKLQVFNLQCLNQKEEEVQGQNHIWIIKLQSTKIQKLYINCKNRISSKVQTIIRQKYYTQ